MNYLDVIKPFLLSEVDREFNSELDNIFVKKQFDENYTQSRKQEVTKKLTTDSTFCMKMTYDDFINDFNNGLKLLIDNQIKPYYRANVEINENQKSEVVLDSSNNFLYLKSEISLYSKVRHELLPIIEYLKDLKLLHYINILPGTTEPEPIEKPEPIENFVTKLFLDLNIDYKLVPDFVKVLEMRAINKPIKWKKKTTILINVFSCFKFDNIEKTITDNFIIKTNVDSLPEQISKVRTGKIKLKTTKEYKIFNLFYPNIQPTINNSLNIKVLKK